MSGPAELVQAVPYLLGFHPRQSLVLVGLANGILVVTARIDLTDAGVSAILHQTIAALASSGSSEIIALVYDDGPVDPQDTVPLPRAALARRVEAAVAAAQCHSVDVLLVVGSAWWSYSCSDPRCCPRSGHAVPDTPSSFAAAATVAGVVALPDRAALAAQLDPLPDVERAVLLPLIEQQHEEAVAAVLETSATRRGHLLRDDILAAALDSARPGWSGVSDLDAARFGVALSTIAVRDEMWMAIDDDSVDGRALWLDLARRLPSPYDASPLFLYGWRSWRGGDGALARIAADRAVASDPQYSAADLLAAALANGVDPRRMPRLRLPA